MKQRVLLISMIALQFSFFTSNVQATTLIFPELSDRSACAAYIPDMPGLPQEDDFICGDVTGDGLVNVLDIIALVSYIMGGSPNPFNVDAADITADDTINVLDIIAMVNIIMQVPGQPCGCVAPVLYEGQTYPTVQIGDQCWFRENLDVGTMINSNAGGQLMTNNGIIEKYCYDNNANHCNTYGGLYEWNEAMQYVTAEGAQGICPPGWHIANDNEWKVLEGTVDSQYPVGDPEWDQTLWRGSDAGGNLKQAGTSHWNSPNIGATNSSEFTGLPGGYRSDGNGSFANLGYNGIFWSSSQNSTTIAWYRTLGYYNTTVFRGNYSYKDSGFSIRCLKDCWPEPTQANAGPDQLNVPGTSTTLAGNTPTYGTGLWTIVSGTGGTIVTPASPTSEFQGLAGNEYTLSWTITTQCGSSVDEVVISFAEASTFNCGDDLLYEGQSYATVLIGTHCWMAENLNVGTMIVSNTGGQLQTNNGVIEKYCYSNNATYCDTYGGLYEWNEAMQYVTTEGVLGICPVGWHFPTDGEWTTLTDFLGGSSIAGGKIKSTGTIEDGTGLYYAPNTGATNSSGFTGLPGGLRYDIDGLFYPLGNYGYFWSSSQYSTDYAWSRGLSYNSVNVSRGQSRKEIGFSMRCLQDTP